MTFHTRLIPLPSPTEVVNARRLLASAMGLQASADRELTRINADPASDPDGERGALLEARILLAQSVINHNTRVLTGFSVDELGKGMGL